MQAADFLQTQTLLVADMKCFVVFKRLVLFHVVQTEELQVYH